MLMLAVLSIGILTALTATGMPQVQPVFADEDDECNDNDDKNCNEKEIEQTNNCRIEVDNSDNSGGTSQNNGGLSTFCDNFAANPDDVDEQSQVGRDQSQSLEPNDQVFGELPTE
jgi:hypothetical protein